MTARQQLRTGIEESARLFATKAHAGQYRKAGEIEYITHPAAVVQILKTMGITDEIILAAEWLHDVKEDCNISGTTIDARIGSKVGALVQALTRDCPRDAYKSRIAHAKYAVQIIKLADTVHNCSTLCDELPTHTILRKIEDCRDFYLHLAQRIAPPLHAELTYHISPWMRRLEEEA